MSEYLDLEDLRDERDNLEQRDDLDEYETARLAELRTIDHYLDNAHNERTAIPESEFEDYAWSLAEDMYGSTISYELWPFDHIDWEAAADALKIDYVEFDFEGDTYLVRKSYRAYYINMKRSWKNVR